MMRTPIRGMLIAVLGLLVVAGLAAGLVQFREGLAATGLGEPGVWGLYVVCFAYFLGIGAGALTLASVALRFGSTEHRPLATIASVVALVALMLAGTFITADLGRPERAYLMILKMQVRSPLVWDFMILNGLLMVAGLYVLVPVRSALIARGGAIGRLLDSKLSVLKRLPRVVTAVAGPMLVVAPVAYLLTARVFSSVVARDPWHTPLLAPAFLVSALLSGVAASAIAARLAGAARPAHRLLTTVLVVLIITDVVLLFVPVGTVQQFDAPSAAGAHFSGAVLAELVVGLLAPLGLILATWRRERPLVMLPGALILVGVLIKRWHIIVSGSLHRSLPLPSASYWPNGVELAVCAGIASGGVLMIFLLARLTTRTTDPKGGT
jgi:dimethyl sulfoxide reductase membrane subunit